MDNILKKMLAVEAEADKIVQKATQEAEKIREQGRLQANEWSNKTQNQLAEEVESFLRQQLQQAREQRQQQLASAEHDLRQRQQEFQSQIALRLPALCQALLGVGADS